MKFRGIALGLFGGDLEFTSAKALALAESRVLVGRNSDYSSLQPSLADRHIVPRGGRPELERIHDSCTL